MLDTLTGLASPWGYVLVGVLAAAESAAFVGLFLPGEAAVLAGGFLVFRGRADLAIMMVSAGAGAVIGDSIGYEIGRHFGATLRRSRIGRRVGEHRWERAERYLREHGGRAVFLGRFVGLMRALVPALAGASRLPYRRFVLWNALGGLIWAPGLVVVGYLAGRSYQQVARFAGAAGLLLLALLAVVAGIVYLARWVAGHGEAVHAGAQRQLDRPLVQRLARRYTTPLQFLAGRLRPGRALGLSLTVQLAALAGTGALFAGIVQDVIAGDELARLDSPVSRYVIAHRAGWLTGAMRWSAMLGSTAVLVPAVILVGLLARRRLGRWLPLGVLAAAQAGSIALYDTVKILVSRPRPHISPLVATASGYSFPSGHATQAVAVWGALAFLAGGSLSRWRSTVAVWALAGVICLVVGLSRVYLGVHWATDVLGGWALGAAWLGVIMASVSAVKARDRRLTAQLPPA